MRCFFSFGIFVLFAVNQSTQFSLKEPTQHTRIARSYYPSFEPVLPPITAPSISYGTAISKDELIALLEAYKEVEQGDKQLEQAAPAPAAVPEQPAAAAGAGAETGMPLTLSLPAFVPIQLSAMYAAPAGQAAQAAVKQPVAEQAAPEQEAREPEAPAAAVGDSHDTLLRLLKAKFVGQKPVSPLLASPVVKEIPAVTKTVTRIINPVKVTRYISDYPPITRIYTSPPSLLGHGSTVLRLVPSSSLLSNWH